MFIRRASSRCRWLWPLAVASLLPAASLLAEPANTPDAPKDTTKDIPREIIDEAVPLNTLDVEGTYVGQSAFKIKRFDGAGASTQESYDSISETQLSLEYGRRFQLFGKVYFRAAASYERFDFSSTNAPLPTSLQSLGGVLALEYIDQGEIGAFLRVTPGLYYSDIGELSRGNFNAPVALGIVLPVYRRSVFVLVGAEANALAKYPVLPIAGLAVVFSKHVRLMATPPDPRLIYSVNDNLDFFVGAEILGDSYKRNSSPGYRQQDQRFNKAVIDYSELRVGGGITYTPLKKLDLDIDVVGGWDFGQDFDYYRGEGSKRFETKGAPYARLSLTTKF